VTWLIAFAMPGLMLALMFFLADIESRHLTQRTRVEMPSAEPAEGPASATA
jgi:hypothetical protein